MNKENFCYLCPYIEYYPPSFFDPGDAECPGELDPEKEYCPRHREWLEEQEGEMEEEEEENETNKINPQKL